MTPPRTTLGRRLEMAACVLDHEARTGRGIGVVAVAERIGREKTQVSRGLATLAEVGLVERLADGAGFATGPGLLGLAAGAGDARLVAAAWPRLESLTIRFGERAELAVLDAGEVLTIESTASASTIQIAGWPGRRLPVHCTAAGQALLADAPVDAVAGALGAGRLPPGGPAAPRSAAEARRRLAAARRAGYAISDEELDAEVVSVAAPVRVDGRTRAAIALTGPGYRFRAGAAEAGRALVAAADAIAEALAGP